jgi:ubiquinone biosynthesis protein
VIRRAIAVVVEALRLSLRCFVVYVFVRSEHERSLRRAEAFADALDRLGGAFQKGGQFLSTRPDLLGAESRRALSRLCDRAVPLSERAAEHALAAALSAAQRSEIAHVDLQAFACGSVSQVHLARLRDGRLIALKLLRPDARRRFEADLALGRKGAAVLARLPQLGSVPVLAAFGQFSASLAGHLDLRLEASRQRSCRQHLAADRAVIVPALVDELCSERVIAMEYVAGAKRVDDPGLEPALRRAGLRGGLRVLYRMIFELGLVHCDFHPGNLLVAPAGRLVVLDFGYVAAVPPSARRQFTQFFLAIALDDAELATRVIVETANGRPPARTDGLERELAALLRSVHGLGPGEFQITGLVHRLFEIQRRQGIPGTPAFAMMILALVSYEGLLKLFEPTLDFQREAIPYLLGRAAAMRPEPAFSPSGPGP